ncbi:hypothetical protein BaRGS_00030174 [Batillaria attramentaria]|uniref:Uncharacterized protein n=1 Tax=Batillaria attramentaria TaxID=370345 RepID=A0ABD0JVB6_9CAEN
MSRDTHRNGISRLRHPFPPLPPPSLPASPSVVAEKTEEFWERDPSGVWNRLEVLSSRRGAPDRGNGRSGRSLLRQATYIRQWWCFCSAAYFSVKCREVYVHFISPVSYQCLVSHVSKRAEERP